jgi:hypothetical protein
VANTQRVTIRLARELATDIDRWEKDRGKFVAEAVRNELDRRRHAELQRSIENPHAESANFIDEGLREWVDGLPPEDAEALVDMSAGKPLRWIPGTGWTEDGE